jgi:hypothetical protein
MLNNKLVSVLLLILFLFHFPVNVLFASDDDVHNRQMLQVLFGKNSSLRTDDGRLFYVESFSGHKKESILALQKAVYWCVDEYNGHIAFLQGYPRQYLNDLRRFGVDDIPQYDMIDFKANWYHERYTHKGWDFDEYPRNYQGYNFQTIWELRKNLLLATVDKTFNFRPDEMIKKDSFAALIYYTHILGDHSGNTKGSLEHRIPINGSRRGRTMERGDIIWELEYHIPRLFREQTNVPEYRFLMNYLKNHTSKPSFIYARTISDDDYIKLKKFAEDVLEALIENIPALLRNEVFFTRVFS